MLEKNNGIFIKEDKDGDIFIVGDLHGDYQCMIHALVDLCKACSITKIYNDTEFNTNNREYLEWKSENNSTVVFCGDLIHRKRFIDHVMDDECSDIYIIKTLMRLKNEAIKHGGNIIIITGNHEIMNIINPNDNTYTSKKNINSNFSNFTNKKFITEFVNNSYAWIKINDILIAHGGLCSEYLKYLDSNSINQHGGYYYMIGGNKIRTGNEIIEYVNKKYKEYFIDYDYKNIKKDKIGHYLFVEYDLENKNKHNMFWCREWGYNHIDCEKYKEILSRVDCDKMIISHCPQFLTPSAPQMINFECLDDSKSNNYKLARVDLGMSRAFDYNKEDRFMYYLNFNFNRKIAILKLQSTSNNLYFNYDSIITNKLSCIQYLLLKYGMQKEEWTIPTNWIGFEYIKKIFKDLKNTQNATVFKVCKTHVENNPMLCLMYPLLTNKNKIDSINQFKCMIKLL